LPAVSIFDDLNVRASKASSFHGTQLSLLLSLLPFLCAVSCRGYLTHKQASGVAMTAALYYLMLLAAGSAFVQQFVRLPFSSGSLTPHVLKTSFHLLLCLLVCSSCWLSISKFHSSMTINENWREDGCTDSNGALGVEFVLHFFSGLLYFCMSRRNWLPSHGEDEYYVHHHDE
jgi:hypothetical protein